jgi:hypothetical protein
MNHYTKAEAHAASILRAEARLLVRKYETQEEGAARIALLAAALEAEIREQGGKPEAYTFFTGEQNE